jgi:hypothetical protein
MVEFIKAAVTIFVPQMSCVVGVVRLSTVLQLPLTGHEYLFRYFATQPSSMLFASLKKKQSILYMPILIIE